jgi:uncharacterized membrane protein YebE (DUF533 family)
MFFMKGGKSKKMNKNVVFTTVLVVALLACAGYIAFDKYTNWKMNENVAIYQQGVSYGYQQAVLQVANSVAAGCQEVPLTVGNQTIGIIGTYCFQQAPAEGQGQEAPAQQQAPAA